MSKAVLWKKATDKLAFAACAVSTDITTSDRKMFDVSELRSYAERFLSLVPCLKRVSM